MVKKAKKSRAHSRSYIYRGERDREKERDTKQHCRQVRMTMSWAG
jgi:hypothetical protein